jgi:hypothetical protein
MKFTYKGYLVELLVLGIEYPTYPCKKGERAVTSWQILIEDEKPRVRKGSKKEIIDLVKKHIRQINGDEFYSAEDEDNLDKDEFGDEDDSEDELID